METHIKMNHSNIEFCDFLWAMKHTISTYEKTIEWDVTKNKTLATIFIELCSNTLLTLTLVSFNIENALQDAK